MASFPDLRPHRRSAKAESSVASKTRTRLLLVVSATLLFTAFVAVTELATLRGKKAHDASAFLTRELGPPLDTAPLVRTPAPDIDVSVSPEGFRVKRGTHSLGLALVGGKPKQVTSFAHGISTKTDFGRTVVAVSPKKTEQYLVVDKHYGTKTWSWQLDTAGLTPRVGGDGSVGFIAGHRLTDQFLITAPTILDLRGRDISPRGLHWDVARREGKWSLELAFDDSNLATPYVIDPASFNNGAGTVGPTAAAANIALTLPGSIKLGDLLIAHVTWKGGSNITATEAVPGTWTQLDVTRNQATNIGAQVWYKNATVADTTGGSYTWNFAPNAIATGGIAAYTGIDKSATPAVSGIATAATNDNAVYYPAITPSANGAQVISVVGWNRVSNGGNLTPPAAVNGAAGAPGIATDRWETVNSGAITSELSDFTQNVAAAVNTPGSNNAGGSGKNIAHVAFRIALKADITAPTSSFALSSVSPAGSAYYSGAGTTVWYRGTGPNCAAEVQVAGKCSFKITNTVSDAGSGPASSIFAALGSPGTHWTFTNGTVTTPAGGPYVSNFYAWTTGATETPTDLITGTDGGGNTDGGTTLTFNNDVTGPAVPTPSVTAQYYTSLSVPVSLGAATDTGGSGVNAATITVERDTIGPLPRNRRRQRRQLHHLRHLQHRQGRQRRPHQQPLPHLRLPRGRVLQDRQHDLLSRRPVGRRLVQDQERRQRFRVGTRLQRNRRPRRHGDRLDTHSLHRQRAGRRPVRLEHLHVGAEHQHLTDRDRHGSRRSRQHHSRSHPHADRRFGSADREHADRDGPVLHQPLRARDREHRLGHGRHRLRSRRHHEHPPARVCVAGRRHLHVERHLDNRHPQRRQRHHRHQW